MTKLYTVYNGCVSSSVLCSLIARSGRRVFGCFLYLLVPENDRVKFYRRLLPRDALQCKARSCYHLSSVRPSVRLWRWWIM